MAAYVYVVDSSEIKGRNELRRIWTNKTKQNKPKKNKINDNLALGVRLAVTFPYIFVALCHCQKSLILQSLLPLLLGGTLAGEPKHWVPVSSNTSSHPATGQISWHCLCINKAYILDFRSSLLINSPCSLHSQQFSHQLTTLNPGGLPAL